MWVTFAVSSCLGVLLTALGVLFTALGVSFTTAPQEWVTQVIALVSILRMSECSLHGNTLTSAQLLLIGLQALLVDLTNQSSPFVAFGAAQFQLLELGVSFTEMGILLTSHRSCDPLHKHSSVHTKNVTIACGLMPQSFFCNASFGEPHKRHHPIRMRHLWCLSAVSIFKHARTGGHGAVASAVS